MLDIVVAALATYVPRRQGIGAEEGAAVVTDGKGENGG